MHYNLLCILRPRRIVLFVFGGAHAGCRDGYKEQAGGSGGDDTTTLKPYFAADSRYVVVGGETCADGYSPENDCAATNSQAYGDTELRKMHYSYLNTDYNQEVNNDWQTGGCMDAIKRSLGYRLELTSGTLPAAALAGDPLAISLDLRNVGYAVPFNARGLELILRETTSGEVWRVALDEDLRTWHPEAGTITLAAAPCLPAGMPVGNYAYLLYLPDPMPALYGRPDYSIRLASKLSNGDDGWEPTTGFNALGLSVSIAAGGTAGCAGPAFVADNLSLPLELTAFTATAEKTTIRLGWNTQQEAGVAYFALERREGASGFREIHRRPATNAETADYGFADAELVAGVTYYYRLRGVDFDGRQTLSGVISARLLAGPNEPSLFPNPTDGRLALRWAGEAPASGAVTVMNTFGKVVLRTGLTTELQFGKLLPGAYLVKVETETGRWVRRVVVR